MAVTPLQRFWYLLKLLGWNYYDVLKPHGVSSFKYLSVQRQEEIVNQLQAEWNSRSKRPRGAVIHYLCMMPNYNFKTITGEPHYELIDEWCVKHFKKQLNRLSLAELNKAVSAVKSWYAKELKK
jgi:hypothetical protein